MASAEQHGRVPLGAFLARFVSKALCLRFIKTDVLVLVDMKDSRNLTFELWYLTARKVSPFSYQGEENEGTAGLQLCKHAFGALFVSHLLLRTFCIQPIHSFILYYLYIKPYFNSNDLK